jgi:hypothetical protein
MAGGRNVEACRRRRLVNVGVSIGTGGTFQRKRSPEEEKSKLVSRRRIPEVI